MYNQLLGQSHPTNLTGIFNTLLPYCLLKDVVVVLVVTGHRYHRTKGDANGVKDLSSSIDPHLQRKINKDTQAQGFVLVFLFIFFLNHL